MTSYDPNLAKRAEELGVDVFGYLLERFEHAPDVDAKIGLGLQLLPYLAAKPQPVQRSQTAHTFSVNIGGGDADNPFSDVFK